MAFSFCTGLIRYVGPEKPGRPGKFRGEGGGFLVTFQTANRLWTVLDPFLHGVAETHRGRVEVGHFT